MVLCRAAAEIPDSQEYVDVAAARHFAKLEHCKCDAAGCSKKNLTALVTFNYFAISRQFSSD